MGLDALDAHRIVGPGADDDVSNASLYSVDTSGPCACATSIAVKAPGYSMIIRLEEYSLPI